MVSSGLRLRLLWWRASLPFRFAHKPLCERFEPHVLRAGPLHLCRSCTLAYTAAAATFGTGLLTGFDPVMAVAVVVPVTVAGSIPPAYARFPRPLRDLLRAGLGASIALCLLWTLRAPLHGVAALTTLGLAAVALHRVRARRARHACDGCPHDGRPGVCPGFELQAQRARDYERVASELVTLGAAPPRCVSR